MIRSIGTYLFTFLVAVVAFPAAATAQTSDRSDLRSSASDRRDAGQRRESDDERQDRRFRAAAQKATTPTDDAVYVRLAPGFTSTDTGLTFSTGMHLVVDTTDSKDGMGFFTLRPSFRTVRKLEDRTHVPGGGIGADLQLNKNSHAIGQFVVSGDFLHVKERFDLGTSGIGWERTWDRQTFGTITVSASAAYARIALHESDTLTDVVPGVGVDYVTPTTVPVRLSTAYTFDNDVDGEDDYEFSMRVKVGEKAALRLGAGKNGRVFGGFTVILDKAGE